MINKMYHESLVVDNNILYLELITNFEFCNYVKITLQQSYQFHSYKKSYQVSKNISLISVPKRM